MAAHCFITNQLFHSNAGDQRIGTRLCQNAYRNELPIHNKLWKSIKNSD